jgi:hypothetical protein
MFFNGNSGLTAIAFNGLQAHCPVLLLRLQGIYFQYYGKFSEKFPGTENSIICRIYCRFFVAAEL